MFDGKTRNGALIISLAILLPIFFLLGILFGTAKNAAMAGALCVVNLSAPEGLNKDMDFSPFWRAWGVLDEKFVGSGTTTILLENSDERIWGAISGMVSSLNDPYTVFLPPKEKKSFESDIKGSFGGVGIELGMRDNILAVISALENTPAKKAGIMAGDKIIEIDGQTTEKMSIEKAIFLIRGEVGTKIKMLIRREKIKDPIPFEITRTIINVPIIETVIYPGNIFSIKLYSFNENSPALFRKALFEFIKSGSNKLILDLRGNPGGYMDAAVNMASWFLPQGKVVLREQIGPNKEERLHRSVRQAIFTKNLKMVILIDRGSASASEILASALSEHGVAITVGEKTFGKGSVQELINITDDTALKVTVARWLTPKGISISEQGLIPDIEIVNKDEDLKAGRDSQLEAAILFLQGKTTLKR